MTAKHTGCLGPGCPLCPLLGRPEYASVYEMLTGLQASDNQPRERCRHLGQPTGRTIECGSCPQGKTRMKEFACGKYTTCTLGVTTPAQHGCVACPSYERYGLRVHGCWGIGDWILAEGMLTQDEREQMTEAWVVCPQAERIRELWMQLPNYPRLRVIHTRPTPGVAHDHIDGSRRAGIAIPSDVRDYSQHKLLPGGRRGGPSSLLAYDLGQCPMPARPYIVVVPWSRGYGSYRGRDFTHADWLTVHDVLIRYNLWAVVPTWPQETIPDTPRLLNWSGRLTVSQAVTLLGHSQGYMGIDSCLSVLAAQLFPASRLSVRYKSPFVVTWADRYYWPHKTHAWLSTKIQPITLADPLPPRPALPLAVTQET